MPQKIDPQARYLFYSHGRIVEEGRRPTSPQFGVYEYDQILETLRARGFLVISEQRPKGTVIEKYAEKVAEQVRNLLKAGVPPRRITVVGASQGSWIAMLASTYLKNRGLNFVFIAGCSADEEFVIHPEIRTRTFAADHIRRLVLVSRPHGHLIRPAAAAGIPQQRESRENWATHTGTLGWGVRIVLTASEPDPLSRRPPVGLRESRSGSASRERPRRQSRPRPFRQALPDTYKYLRYRADHPEHSQAVDY